MVYQLFPDALDPRGRFSLIGCVNLMLIPGCALISLVICLPLYLYFKSRDLVLAGCFKVLGSVSAAVPALVAAIRLDDKCWLCVIPLLLYAVADFLILYRADFGGALFGMGHLILLSYLLTRAPVSLSHLICFLLLAGCSAYIIYRYAKKIDKQLIPLVLYTLMLCLMCGSAIAGGFSLFSPAGWFMAAAGALMFVSDVLLAIKTFQPGPAWFSPLLMVFYYGALLCFGASCMF